jgi:hypothetical protein
MDRKRDRFKKAPKGQKLSGKRITDRTELWRMQQDRRSKTGQVTVYNLSGKRTEADTSYKRRIRLCFPVQGCIIMNMVPLGHAVLRLGQKAKSASV